jgi:hypothetical protein
VSVTTPYPGTATLAIPPLAMTLPCCHSLPSLDVNDCIDAIAGAAGSVTPTIAAVGDSFTRTTVSAAAASSTNALARSDVDPLTAASTRCAPGRT